MGSEGGSSMLVKFQGFRLTPGDGITLAEFAHFLVKRSHPAKEHSFNGRSRLFLFEEESNKDFYTGLFVTIKDHKKYCELRDDGGKFRIQVSKVGDDSNLMEFNFFIINKTSFCGIYQYYHSSCSLGQFVGFVREIWKEYKMEKIEKEASGLVNIGRARSKDAALKRARRKYKKNVGYSMYYKPESFQELVSELKKIKYFEYKASTRVIPDDSFGPQNKRIGFVTQKIQFASQSIVNKIGRDIANFVSRENITNGRIFGVDQFDVERSIYIQENVENFGEFDFDDIADYVELDLDNFSESWVTERLIESAEENRALFYDK